MNLIDVAEQDNAFLLEDTQTGFGYSIILTPPSPGVPVNLSGDFDSTSMSTDPITGQKFAQAKSSVTVRSIRLVGHDLNDTWGVTVKNGATVKYQGYVSLVLPDATIGWTTIILERVGA